MMSKINYEQMIIDCGRPKDVAKKIGVHYTSVYRWRKGQLASVSSLAKLLTHFKIDVEHYKKRTTYVINE